MPSTDGMTSSGHIVDRQFNHSHRNRQCFQQGLIPANQIAISFEPVNQDRVFTGEITWGGVDPSKFIGDINFAYGTSGESITPTGSGMVDTGTTLLWLEQAAFSSYAQANGAVFASDTQTGLLQITPAQFNTLQSLFFTISISQVWPPALNSAIGGEPDVMYLVVALGSSGQGFINGQVFLERFYSVWDTTSHRVGFANTPKTIGVRIPVRHFVPILNAEVEYRRTRAYRDANCRELTLCGMAKGTGSCGRRDHSSQRRGQ
ncbi:aspartic peptidase domain-containing protein [Mycena vulgaris]|nr:aspartic peptidase domain-containing protein [Mycena vulgaris]